MTELRKVMVTGAAGLIGHATCLELARRNIAYVGVDRVAGHIDGVDVQLADLSDIHRLYALVAAMPVDAIIHCAAHSGPMVLADNPALVLGANISATVNLLELARVWEMKRFVYCSSVSAIGPVAGSTDGDTVLRPTTAYGASKAACEAAINAYKAQFGLDGVCLRFSSVYGPRRATDCVLRDMVRASVKRVPFRQAAGGDFQHQYVHVDDAARAQVLALKAPNLPRLAYMITGGDIISVRKVAELLREILGDADIEVGAGPEPKFDDQAMFDISPAARDFGFRPAISLREGIRAYAAAMRGAA